ncbi:MAG: hypothetical protein K2Q24_15660 [Chitinophagaceae bacterium]|nr:hypothetical protein [Chitinophagaceae bacterium]
MKSLLLICLALSSFVVKIDAQSTVSGSKNKNKPQTFGIHGSLFLLEHPLGFYPGITFTYSKYVTGSNRHQIAVAPQFGLLVIPDVENKYIFTVALQYKYASKKRFEASASIGANYILTRLAFDRYEYEGTEFKNKGNLLHKIAPSAAFSVVYKIIKKKKFSISPQLGVSVIKFNKSYTNNLFTGYKPSFNIGININK